MDFTKFFEPVRGIVGYLISRMATIIVTIVLLFINFDFNKEFAEVFSYSSKYEDIFAKIVTTSTQEDKSILVTIFIVFVIIGIIEAHSSILMFLNKLSPFTFVSSYPNFDPFQIDVDFIWKCYCSKFSIEDLEKLHQIRKAAEDAKNYSRPTEIFDYVSGWIFMLIIFLFYFEVRSTSTFLESIFVLLVAGWFWAYRQAQRGSFGWEESRKAAFWLYEHRLHDPQQLTAEQQEILSKYHKYQRDFSKFREPGASIRISWLDFLYRLLIPSTLRMKVATYRWKREREFREALASLFGDGIGTRRR